MNNVNKYLNTDYFKIGRADNVRMVRNVNISAVSIAFIIALNITFFFFVYSTTYYGKLGEVEQVIKVIHLIIKEYKEKGQVYFDKINIGLKIMPSYNTEKNAIFMDKVNDVNKS